MQFKLSTDNLSFRYCDDGGAWQLNERGVAWSNYSSCLNYMADKLSQYHEYYNNVENITMQMNVSFKTIVGTMNNCLV